MKRKMFFPKSTTGNYPYKGMCFIDVKPTGKAFELSEEERKSIEEILSLCRRKIGEIKIPSDFFAFSMWNFKKEYPIIKFLEDRVIAKATTERFYEEENGQILYKEGKITEKILPPYQILFTPKKFLKEKIEVYRCEEDNHKDVYLFVNSIGRILFVGQKDE